MWLDMDKCSELAAGVCVGGGGRGEAWDVVVVLVVISRL